VVISDIKISNKSLAIGEDSPLQQDISLTSDLHLRYDQNDIAFICAALHYLNPEKNQYAFWLENFDEDWRQAGTTRTATYTNLDPGRYVFHVKAANSDGVWNEQPRSLAIFIHPPWYATIWAYIVYFLIVSGIIYTLWSTQLRRIRLRDALQLQKVEAKKLQEIDRLKTQFLANISHEFRTPLTLILGPIDTLLQRIHKKEDVTELSIMRRNAQRLSRLVNQLLDLSKIQAGKMNLLAQQDDIVKFINRIIQSFESRAKLKNISLDLISEASAIDLFFDHEKMEHVFYNLLSNAIKFTPEHGAVNVRIRKVSSDHQLDNSPAKRVEISVQAQHLSSSCHWVRSISKLKRLSNPVRQCSHPLKQHLNPLGQSINHLKKPSLFSLLRIMRICVTTCKQCWPMLIISRKPRMGGLA
jgi:signal transduction histidine kinase